MFVLKLVPALFIMFLLPLGLQMQFSFDQAYASCLCCQKCGSNSCGLCCCRGTTTDCPACGGVVDTFESTNLMDKVGTDIRAPRNIDENRRVMYLGKVGECVRRNFALRVLGDAGENLKTEQFSFDKQNVRDGMVSLKIADAAEQ